ncbi:hypothetical protein [Streptomyces lonarensis]|uniref:Uncharacterized protein n=1 Tax=Streptomyces lonarensis TaxID=700599 RepID=A0A7X6HYW2_9ACTN|nr:hypothetical protein [Streptomyces lonarensis]NJQ05981.1 hypothetical protein [Streptomyces lonarensis]
MTEVEIWRLVDRATETTVGEIHVEDMDYPWLTGRFAALPGFGSFRPLFDALSDRLETEDWDGFERVHRRIDAALALHRPEHGAVPDYLIRLDGDEAAFRWADAPFPAL